MIECENCIYGFLRALEMGHVCVWTTGNAQIITK